MSIENKTIPKNIYKEEEPTDHTSFVIEDWEEWKREQMKFPKDVLVIHYKNLLFETIKLRKAYNRYLALKEKHKEVKKDYMYLQKCYLELSKEKK